MALWSNWRSAGHIRSEITCNQAREIICQFVTSYYKFIYFPYSEGLKRNVILISSAALLTSATHTIDIKTLS
jgi:hypothetical protein